MCDMSHVMCHMSRVSCRMSRVTYNFFYDRDGEAYRWRVCYQRGLPCLVLDAQASQDDMIVIGFFTD